MKENMKSAAVRLSLILAGGAFILYAAAMLLYVRLNAGQMICLLLGMPMLLLGILYPRIAAWKRYKLFRGVLLTLRIGYAAAALIIVVFCGMMAYAALQPAEPGAGAVIVLGAGLRGEEVSLTLRRRLDAAYSYLTQNPETVCVLSGGQGRDEPIAEAEAMARYLQMRGIAPERLIKEDQSTNTAQNIAYSYSLLHESGLPPSVVIASNDFHILRGILLAKGAGFTGVSGLAAPSEPYLLPQYCLREIIGITKDFLLGRFG